ncbi:hypothetical protein A9Q99_00165 [Gammaproteobacteria bacterium 45_16_T64]|nr:hypothetical protein A9Q99_00165 [Gammaproteobacteria bacterium 45_16_T64]
MSAINRWLNKKIGFVVSADTQDNIDQALLETARNLRMTKEELVQGLLSNSIDPTPFIESVVTNESFFFRYEAQMNSVITTVIKPMIKEGRTPRILSLPCAAGEEAFSFSMLLQTQGVNLDNVRIFAADVSKHCIRKAQDGIYTEYDFRRTSTKFKQQFFSLTKDRRYIICPKIRKSVEFHCHNIFLGLDKISSYFDVIFFNNLLIYLDAPHVTRALRVLEKQLSPNGWIIIDSTEAPRCREVFSSAPLGGVTAFRHKGHIESEPTKNIGPSSPSDVSAVSRKTFSDVLKQRKKTENIKGATLTTNLTLHNQKKDSFEKQLVEKPSDSLNSLHALSCLYADQGQDLQAMETAEQAISLHESTKDVTFSSKKLADLHSVLALGFRAKGLDKPAQREIDIVLKLYPEHPVIKIFYPEKRP